VPSRACIISYYYYNNKLGASVPITLAPSTSWDLACHQELASSLISIITIITSWKLPFHHIGIILLPQVGKLRAFKS